MDKRYVFLVGLTICVLIVIILLNRPQQRREIVHTIYHIDRHVSHSSPLSNKIIRFVQLPSEVNDTARLDVYGEIPIRSVEIAVNPSGDLISDSIRNSGQWEGNYIQTLIDYLQLHSELNFLDIGANIGVFTLNVASIRPVKRKILSVDANERNCQLLGKSLSMNGWSDQVTIVNNALDQERAENSLIISKGNIGGAYVQHGNEQNRHYTDVKVEKIHCILFDDLLEVIPFHEAVMKIDIEFSENRAFKSAKRFFQMMKIPAVMIEWYAGDLRRTTAQYEELLEFFYNQNYEPFTSVSPSRILLSRSSWSKWPPDVVWLLKGYNHTTAT